MARRFGGTYSPEGSPDQGSYRGARRSKAGGRVNLLFLAPLPLIWQAFGNGPVAMALNLAALGLLLLAAWLTRAGLQAEEAYDARKIARRPAFPRKMAASVLTGGGLALAGFAASGGFVAPLLYAVVGALLHGFSFGLDPLRNKGMEGIDTFQTDRVAQVVDKAETHMREMRAAADRSGDRGAIDRVARFQGTVRDMLRTVEDDPRDLTAARKFLGVYLMGARDATIKFADIYARSRDAGARSDYMMLLTDLEENFNAKTQRLLEDSNTDLEVEISVLRDRLEREGVHLDHSLKE